MLSVTYIKKYGTDTDVSCYYIEHQKHNNRRTYLFYDNVHLVKNIRNNLLNVKKYVFPAFESKIGEETFSCPAGYISWSALHRVYDKDKELQGNLRKARKLSYKALHPGNSKQDRVGIINFWWGNNCCFPELLPWKRWLFRFLVPNSEMVDHYQLKTEIFSKQTW